MLQSLNQIDKRRDSPKRTLTEEPEGTTIRQLVFFVSLRWILDSFSNQQSRHALFSAVTGAPKVA